MTRFLRRLPLKARITKRDLVGHFGYVLLASGAVLLGLEWREGWLLHLAGDVVWVALGWRLGMSSIVLWSIGFAAVDIFGYVSWGSS